MATKKEILVPVIAIIAAILIGIAVISALNSQEHQDSISPNLVDVMDDNQTTDTNGNETGTETDQVTNTTEPGDSTTTEDNTTDVTETETEANITGEIIIEDLDLVQNQTDDTLTPPEGNDTNPGNNPINPFG